MEWVDFTAGALAGAIVMGMAILAIPLVADAVVGYPQKTDDPGQDDGLEYARRQYHERSYGRFDDQDFI